MFLLYIRNCYGHETFIEDQSLRKSHSDFHMLKTALYNVQCLCAQISMMSSFFATLSTIQRMNHDMTEDVPLFLPVGRYIIGLSIPICSKYINLWIRTLLLCNKLKRQIEELYTYSKCIFSKCKWHITRIALFFSYLSFLLIIVEVYYGKMHVLCIY